MKDERKGKQLSLHPSSFRLHPSDPPPTKCTTSTRSPSLSVTRGHSARRTTSPFSSTAMRSGASKRLSMSAWSVVPSSVSLSSPLSLIFKRCHSLLVDDSAQLGELFARGRADD